jgi:hypothetical protein
MTLKDLEKILYFESFVVTSSKKSSRSAVRVQRGAQRAALSGRPWRSTARLVQAEMGAARSGSCSPTSRSTTESERLRVEMREVGSEARARRSPSA